MARFRLSGRNWENRAWTLAPCLVTLAKQIELLHPQPHITDGTVASKAHDKANPSSDHRPHPFKGPGIVRGLDAGETVEDDAWKMAEAVRLSKDPRVKYVLHERRMFSSYPVAGYPAFTWRPYSGPPHDTHVHFSTEPEYDQDTRAWKITGGADMGSWMKPGDPVEDVADMKAVHAWQGNDVLTNKDIDYVESDPKEIDWRAKYHVTKLLNVLMK